MKYLTALGCALIVAAGIVAGFMAGADRLGAAAFGNPRLP